MGLTMSQPTEDKPRRSTSTWWIVAVIVLLVAYPLSIGPVMWLDRHGYVAEPAIDLLMYFYVPLQIVYEYGPEPLQDLLGGYTDLWTP